MSLEKPDPQSQRSDQKTLFSNIPESRNSRVEDTQCPELQDLTEDTEKVNFEMHCLLTSERMSLPLGGGVANDITTTNKKDISDVIEGMELTSSVTSQDVLMSSPEKDTSLQNSILKEEIAPSQSASFVIKMPLLHVIFLIHQA
jgi:hypothetical protein